MALKVFDTFSKIRRIVRHIDKDLFRFLWNEQVLILIKGEGWEEANPQNYPVWMHSIRNSESLTWRIKNPFPCYSFGAVEFIDQNISERAVVFEYGSGTSTLWYARRASKVISVEHNQQWYKLLNRDKPHNVELILHYPEPKDEHTDAFYDSDVIKGFSFKLYVEAIHAYPDEYFDLVSVDGRSRVACLVEAKSKVKKGGFLVLDNFLRDRYEESINLLEQEGWQNIKFVGNGPYLAGKCHTAIFIKG